VTRSHSRTWVLHTGTGAVHILACMHMDMHMGAHGDGGGVHKGSADDFLCR
jgi:hypothetical protein